MKNLINYAFSRNRYFNGKLLTAQDFEQEQQYINDKRRLINRWVLGYGVAAGLDIIQIDDYSISLEMGLAFDQSGREIFVNTPVIQKLSLIDGYAEATREEGSESLYLCIEYSQAETEPVHNIKNDAVHVSGQTENSKYTEGYHLYLTDDEPGERLKGEIYENEAAYISSRAEQIGHGAYERGIYLAKILLVKAGEFYMIDGVVKQPFDQYVYALPLTTGMLGRFRQSLKTLTEKLENLSEAGMNEGVKRPEKTPYSSLQLAEGTAVIPLPERAKAGDVFFSGELVHGLGPGSVQLLLRACDDEYIYSGAAGIFEGEKPSFEMAGRLNRTDGTFIIGVRLLSSIGKSRVSVGFTAIRDRLLNGAAESAGGIFIRPSMVTMNVWEVSRFSAVSENGKECPVKWEMTQPDSGNIDEKGNYHAPGAPGVYEISAKSGSNPEIHAFAYAIVR